MTLRLIVNADDYGHTAGVSAGIREAHLQGIVTSTSAMMNRPAVVEALTAAAQCCPRLGIGVHLVLTSGFPVLPSECVQSLLGSNHKFFGEEGFIEHLPEINLDEVWAEWSAQVEKFVAVTGHWPDHLDSHHHSSYFTPALFEMMLKLADSIWLCHSPSTVGTCVPILLNLCRHLTQKKAWLRCIGSWHNTIRVQPTRLPMSFMVMG